MTDAITMKQKKIDKRKWKIYLYFRDFCVGIKWEIIDHVDQPLFYMTICHFQVNAIGHRHTQPTHCGLCHATETFVWWRISDQLDCFFFLFSSPVYWNSFIWLDQLVFFIENINRDNVSLTWNVSTVIESVHITWSISHHYNKVFFVTWKCIREAF